MYSDESTFRLIRCSSGMVRRPVGSDRYESRYCMKTVKHPEGQMVWGCFSGKGRGSLWFLPPKAYMNSDNYITCLSEKLIPRMKWDKCDYFLQVRIFLSFNHTIFSFMSLHKFSIILLFYSI